MNRDNTSQQPLLGKLGSKMLPPTDLMYLAAIAEDAGCDAKIADYSLGGSLEKDLLEFKPNYIVSNVSTTFFKKDLESLEHAKKILPTTKIIVFGTICRSYNINAIYEKNFLDYVLVGEGEFALKEILENQADEQILGICHRKNFQGVKNPQRPLLENPDDLPFPARHLIDNCIYIGYNKKPQAVIKVAKGCPVNCFHCLATSCHGTQIRTRSAESIINEIKECINKYKIKNFLFDADNFGYDTLWLIDFCDKLIKAKLNINWSAKICTAKITPELANIMHKSGCKHITVSAKHANIQILNNIGNVCNTEEIKATVNALKKHKIKIDCEFTLGLPWENKNSINEVINFAQTLKCDYFTFNAAVPFPNTKFYQYAMQNRLFDLTSTYEQAYSFPVIRTHDLSKEELFRLIKTTKKICNQKSFLNFIKSYKYTMA